MYSVCTHIPPLGHMWIMSYMYNRHSHNWLYLLYSYYCVHWCTINSVLALHFSLLTVQNAGTWAVLGPEFCHGSITTCRREGEEGGRGREREKWIIIKQFLLKCPTTLQVFYSYSHISSRTKALIGVGEFERHCCKWGASLQPKNIVD